MSSEADLMNLPIEFEYPEGSGKIYKIQRIPTMVMETAFADWVFLDAWNYVQRMKAMFIETNGEQGLSDEDAESMQNRITDGKSSGMYDWGSEIVETKLGKSWAGIHYMMMLRFKAHHPEVNLAFIQKLYRDMKERKRLYDAMRPTKPSGEQQQSEQQGKEPPPAGE